MHFSRFAALFSQAICQTNIIHSAHATANCVCTYVRGPSGCASWVSVTTISLSKQGP